MSSGNLVRRSELKRKLLVIIGSAVLVLVMALTPLLGACTPTPTETPTPTPTYTWKTCTPLSAKELGYQSQLKFAKLINERTNGQVEVKTYASEALGPMYDEFENVVRGTQEMGLLPPSPHFDKALQVVNMPYMVGSWEEGEEIYSSGGWMYELLKPVYADIGIELLGFSFLGMDGYGSTKGPVVKPSDIKDLGIKTRVWCTADRSLFEPLGGTVSMPFCDLYTALQTGVCHAQDNAPAATYEQLRDVTKYYTTINWMFEAIAVIMNKELYDSLTPELQEQVQSCMTEALDEYNTLAREQDGEYLQKMEDYGIEVTCLTPEQLIPWIEHGRSVWPDMADECGADIVDYVSAHAR